MSIEAEITRLVEAKQDLATWLEAKDVTVPQDALLGTLVDLVKTINLTDGDARMEIEDRMVTGAGELLVSDTIIDERDIYDAFYCCIAYNLNGRLLVLNPEYGQHYNSSLTIGIGDFTSTTRLYNSNFFWFVDPDLSVLSSGDTFTVISFWRR